MSINRIIAEGEYVSAADGLDEDTAQEFASFIDDMNSTENADAWITVMRIPTDSRGAPMPNSKHLGQLFNEPLGASSVNDVIERIRREFIRPGEASITVRIIGKQQGQKGLKFNRIYTIEKANTSNKSDGSTPLGELGNMLLQMQRASDERAERFERLLAGNSAVVRPAESFADQMVKLAPVIAAAAPIMQALLGRPVAPAGGPNEMLATVRALKEAAGLFGGKTDDGESTLGIVKAVSEAVGPGLRLLAANQEAKNRAAPPALPNPNAASRVTPAPGRAAPRLKPRNTPNKPAATPPEAESMELKTIRENLETLATLCDEKTDPKAVAELVVNSVDEDQLEELYRRMTPENFVAQMKIISSKSITGREEWFEKVRVEILNQFEADPDAEDDDADETDTGTGNEGEDGLRADLDASHVNGSPLDASPVDLDSLPDAGGSA